MSEIRIDQISIISPEGKLLDFDPLAQGADYDGEAFRYDLKSGTIVYQGIDSDIRVIFKNGNEFNDSTPTYSELTVNGVSCQTVKAQDGHIITIVFKK